MRSDRTAAAALVAGAIGFIVTMGLHPTGHAGPEGRVAVAVHALAIVSLLVLTFGFARFVAAAGAGRGPIDAGLVAWAGAAIFGCLAATVSGILMPALGVYAAEAPAGEAAVWEVVFAYNFRLNGALTQVFIGAAATAMVLWSGRLARMRGACRWLGAAGMVIGAVCLAALLSGHLRNNVHDVGLFVLALSLWTIGLGALLGRSGVSGEGLGPHA